MRRINGPKMEGLKVDWREFHNQELHEIYSSPNVIMAVRSRRMRLAGHVAHMGRMRNVYDILVRKTVMKKPLRSPRHRWKDNIKMGL
jgi:hypothetical protein